MGNLKSRTLVAERLWDWEFLNECFQPTKIRISDVDGEVERNGYFLRLEGKPYGVTLNQAQQICFKKLSVLLRPGQDGHEATPAFTILVLYGEPSEPRKFQIWPAAPTLCHADDVRAFVRAWFLRASGIDVVNRPLVQSSAGCIHKPEFIKNGRCYICESMKGQTDVNW